MKYLSLFSKLFLALAVISFASSCGTDDTTTDPTQGPSTFLEDEAGFLSTDATIDAGDVINVRLTASTGTSLLNTLTIYEDGFEVDLSRITIDGADAGANPKLILGEDVNGFTYDISITPHTTGTATYEFEVADADGNKDASTIDVTISSGPLTLELATGSSSLQLGSESLFEVALNATTGSAALSTLTVYEDGVVISDLTRLRYGAVEIANAFDANPFTLPVDDQAGFAKSIWIRSHAEAGVTKTFTVRVEDEALETADLDIVVTLGTIATPFDNEYTGRLVYNADGQNFGGLDLDTGSNVSAFDATADIIDSGLDNNDNWFRTIEPSNGASLRSIDTTQPELFSYDNVSSKEAMIAAYDSGQELFQSGTVNIGDTFTAKVGTTYYIFVVRNLVETSADNFDYYEFDIKQAY